MSRLSTHFKTSSPFSFTLQVYRARLFDDVRADDQLQVRAEDGEEATHGGGPSQAGEGDSYS